MSLNKILKSFSAFAAIAVFAFSVVLIPTTSAATQSGGVSPGNGGATPPSGGLTISAADDKNLAEIIFSSNKYKAGKYQSDSTTEALTFLKKCKLDSIDNTQKLSDVKLADVTACLKKTVKQQSDFCKTKPEKTPQRAICSLTAAKLAAAVKVAQARLDAHKDTVVKPTRPKTYAGCVNYYSSETNTDLLKKRVNKLVSDRTQKINQLKSKANKINNAETKQIALDGLTADQTALGGLKEQVAAAKKPSDAAKIYCEAAFKIQVSSFRARQIAALVAIDKNIKADTGAYNLFNAPSNQSSDKSISNNALKSEIETRLNTARETIGTSINGTNTGLMAYEKAMLKTLKNAQVTQTTEGKATSYSNTLAGMGLNSFFDQIKQARIEAWRNYNEAQALRKVQYDYNIDQRPRLQLAAENPIRFLNENGDFIKRNGKVVVKTDQQKKDQKKQAEGKCADLKRPSEARKRCLAKFYGDEAQKDDAQPGVDAKGLTEKKVIPHTPRKAYVNVKVGNKDYTTVLVRNSDVGAWKITSQEN